MQQKVYCSTGALIGRPNGRNWQLLKDFSKNIFCDGYEFMVYSDWYENLENIAHEVSDFGLNIPVLHCQKGIGEYLAQQNYEYAFDLFEKNCIAAKIIGSQKCVLHLWNGMISDSNIEANINAVAELKDISNAHSVELLIENVVCNCENPQKHFNTIFNRYENIGFVFDTKMAAFHGQLYSIFENENKHIIKNGAIKHMHVNDYAGGLLDWANLKTLHIGDGNLDFAPFFKKIYEYSYTGDFTVEATSFDKNGNIDFDKLNSSLNAVKELISTYCP